MPSLMTETTVAFMTKNTGATLWLEVKFAEDNPPEDMFAAFRDKGWEIGDGMRSLPPLDGIATEHIAKPGSALFTGWTDAEKRANMAEARAILRRFGYTGVPINKLSLADLL